jgi:hypothetical protein
MKSQITFTKKDIAVTLGCLIFLLANLGAVGASGRRRAKEAVCISNLRQWGSVFSAYTADYDGSFHEGWDTGGDSNWWMDAAAEYYMGRPKIRFCPVAANENLRVSEGFVNFGIWDDQWLENKGHRGSYGINGWVEHNQCADEPLWRAIRRWRTPNVLGADKIPLFLDAPWIDCFPEHCDSPPEFDNMPWQQGSQMARFCKNRHEGYINCLFLDYSVRKIGLKEMWILKWHRTYRTDGPWTSCGGVVPSDWPDWMEDFENY